MSEMDLLLHNLRTIGTHHCDGTVGEEAADVIDTLRAENGQLRELLNLYNLGGWMDSERLIKERDTLRELVREAAPYIRTMRSGGMADWTERAEKELEGKP
jgi:hypothetical protein